ncbi:MAG: hypothetical protein JNJ91_04360 [Flavobacteriales bacterium]|nr:hypothetical protein [Flavobacteriales bacterium]
MKRYTSWLLLPCLLIAGCSEDPTPKPRGYFRIDLPEQAYTVWSDSSTFRAEVPVYAKVAKRGAKAEARWFDIRFKGQRATMHLTWSPVENDLQELIEDAHTFKSTHQAKAAKINSERLLSDSTRVFGTLFEIEGDVASPFVFYVTDSTANFLYGSLYFDARPNADSLAPVTARLREDMRHLLTTLHWQ